MFGRKKSEKKDIFISLSYNYISIAYEDSGEVITKDISFDIQTDPDSLIDIYRGAIKQLLANVPYIPRLILLINSSSFLIRTIQEDIDSEDKRYSYIASQLDLTDSDFNLTNVKGNSYLVSEHSAIEKILFSFKDYEIKSLHDSSIVNGLYLLKNKNQLYLNISLLNTDAIVNGDIFQKRTLQNLFLNFLTKVSKKLNLDLNSTYRYIQKNFSNIKTYNELVYSTDNGAVDLRDFIDTITSFIQSTLDYFNNYELLEDIETIYLEGDILELTSIIDIIKDKLIFDGIIEVNRKLKLNSYRKDTVTIAYLSSNEELESSAIQVDGLRYSDGKQEFVFIDNSLVLKKKLTKEQRRKIISLKKVIEVDKPRRDSIENKKVDKSIWKMDGKELLFLLKSKFSSSEDNNRDKDIEDDGELGKIILFVVLLLSYGGYQLFSYITTVEKKFKLNINHYQSTINDISNRENKLIKKDKIFVDDGVNKILWTEKFITLSKNMPDAIWLSSIHLEKKDKEIEDKKVSSTRIVLDGRCLPSTIGHISTIATYMKNLMNSDDNFKKDFIDISFGGAEITFDSSNRKLIRFKLYLNFRRNIHIEQIKKEIDPKDKSIVENLASIKKKSKEKIKVLDNIGKE